MTRELAFSTNGLTAPSGWSRAKARLDRLSGVAGWRFHDLRRTAASAMARLGHPPHVVAAVLNHAPGGTQGITAVYNRFRYDDEKRAALDAWARHIRRIVDGATAEVVELRKDASVSGIDKTIAALRALRLTRDEQNAAEEQRWRETCPEKAEPPRML